MTKSIKKTKMTWEGLTSAFAILNSEFFRVRLYHWLWIALCVAGALAVAAPRVLSQPLLYYATAEARFDTGRYGGIYDLVTPNVTGFDIARQDTLETMRQNALARRELRFGAPDYRVEFLAPAPGSVLVRGIGPDARTAQALANAGAEELVRQLRAAGGREILRNMLGWELWLALQPEGMPAPTPFDALLREIARTQAFPMSRELEPVATPRDVTALTPEEQSDLTRALESRYDLWRFAINTRNATLDALCGSAGLSTTQEREAALSTCSQANPAAAAELAERNRDIGRLRAVGAALRYMTDRLGARFSPDLAGPAQRLEAALPTAPEPRYVLQLIALAAMLGLSFGVAGAAIDRSAGLAAKAQEIWAYRELIRNLVLRDLRARYKGSALGYLWTQLAPLGMMLVFVAVFGFLMPSGIAQFPVFIIVALLPWNFTAEAILGGTRSVIDNAALVKKVYFPREVLPLVTVLSSLLNYLLSLPMMLVVMGLVQLLSLGRLNFAWSFAYLPVLVAIQTVMLTGLALLLGSAAVFFRDMVHLIGIVINIWFFLTPVVYPLSTLSEGTAARLVRWLNPMASLVEFYREILYGAPVLVGQIPTPGVPALSSVLRVGVTAVVLLVVGYWVFQRGSRRFGEEI